MVRITNQGYANLAKQGAIVAVLALAAALSASGIAFAQAAMPGHQAMAAKSAKSEAPMKMHAAMEGMQAKLQAMEMTGDADTDFAMMMVAHHQAAIDMAKAELESGKDPAMLKTARKVIAAQTKEIAQLKTWMKKNHHAM